MELSDTTSKKFGKNKQLKGNHTHVYKRRAISKVDRKETDIYISRKSSNKSYIVDIEKLWANGEEEVTLHALGASISQAIVLALLLEEKHCNAYGLEINTNSLDLVDDLIPTTDEDDFEIQRRWQSSIKIRIYKLKNTNQQTDVEHK